MADTLEIAIDPGLVEEARKLGLDVSAEVASALRVRIEKRKREKAWQDQNPAAIELWNQRIERDGLWYERIRES